MREQTSSATASNNAESEDTLSPLGIFMEDYGKSVATAFLFVMFAHALLDGRSTAEPKLFAIVIAFMVLFKSHAACTRASSGCSTWSHEVTWFVIPLLICGAIFVLFLAGLKWWGAALFTAVMLPLLLNAFIEPRRWRASSTAPAGTRRAAREPAG